MPDSSPRRLPRGRYALSREEVERIQRTRLCTAMAEAMTEKGYVGTSVEDVLKRAVVSRQSFYQLFDSKLDCFMTAFAGAGDLLLRRVLESVGVDEATGQARLEGSPLERFERAVTAYLDVLAAELPFARLFLVEVYAAGPDAIRRRSEVQVTLTNALADLLEVTDDAGRFTCQMIIAAVSAMVTPLVAAGDVDGLRAVGPPVIDHVRRLWESGTFGTPQAAGGETQTAGGSPGS
ncbi:TetR/AcrR family transcriptional regulator [Actinomadura sp. 6N118]|uniref:TetR/AcrR family transcriptional regulator n=1 Tax=Actinomadura sp. 6N118 TaxID=3375151 RepID=UPI003796F1CB